MRLSDAFAGSIQGDNDGSNDARKPGIPILLPCALLLWAANASAYALLEAASASDAFTASAICLAALVISCVIVLASRRRIAMLVAFVVLGAALGAIGSLSYHQSAERLETGTMDVVLELTGDERSSDFGSSCSAMLHGPAGQTAGAIAYFDEFNGFLNGTKLACTAKVSAFPEDDLAREYYADQVAKVDVSEFRELEGNPVLSAMRDVRKQAINVIAEHGGDQVGLLQALVCGYRETLQSSGKYDEFKTCGLAHLVAVSGAHLAIVTMVLGWALKMLRARRIVVLAGSIAFVLCYLVFAGLPISALRAAVMVVVSLLAGVAKRRNATLNSLAACIIGFMLLAPSSCVSVSLFLSAGSTLGIVLFTPLIASWMEGFPYLVRKAVAEPVGMTLASNIATLPFSAALFGMVPMLSLAANVVATPLFTIGCVTGLVCTLAACFVAPFATISMAVASASVMPLSALSSFVARLPYATAEADLPVVPMIAASCALALALWIAWPKISSRVCGAALSLLVASYAAVAFLVPPVDGDQIVMLDVGQGDAFLLRSQGESLLIDTGNEEAKLRDALAFAGIRDIDAVAITHPDDDHCACLSSLASTFAIRSFVCARPMLECPCGKCTELVGDARTLVGEDGLCAVSPGDVLSVGNFSLRVIWPQSFEDEGGNGDSLCLLAELDCDEDGEADWRSMFTGDVESEQLDAMLEAEGLRTIDVLKVGHHGSRVSLDEHAITALQPKVALISVGAGNSYGHPTPEALSLLEGCGTKVIRTDQSGTVVLRFDGDKMTIPRQSK